jgi:hypothetical protein
MLVPSVIMIVSPFVQDVLTRPGDPKNSENIIAASIVFFFWTLCAAAVLSLVMGFLLEKWRHGAVQNRTRVVYYGLMIFFINCLIAFAGCAVGAAIPHS